MDWLTLAKQREDELITDLQHLIQINSVLDEKNATIDAPFGKGPLQALEWMLKKGKEQGFQTKNVENVAGHIEMGQGDRLLGILCHVDVVPVSDDWTYPPFKGEIVDGKLYGRGAIDDKGPTIAAWLAMKMVKDAGIPLNKRVRMIIGTDEESGFRCVDRYFQKEEMPTIGFAPDADFPLINAEKGIADLLFTQKNNSTENEQLQLFTSGTRTNMVPDFAKAVVQSISNEFEQMFKNYLEKNQLEGDISNHEGKFTLSIKGKAAHAMEPEKGVNAAVLLAKFLSEHLTKTHSKQFVSFIVELFDGDIYGKALELDFADDMSGPTTLNPGILNYENGNGTIQVSMRYSVSYPFEEKMTQAQQILSKHPFSLDVVSNSTPHYVPASDDFVQTLLNVYRKYTGDYSNPLSTGGGTYARTMKKGVAFGMLFPGEMDVAHQKDEFVVIENLVKAAAIYAEAIVELASEKEK